MDIWRRLVERDEVLPGHRRGPVIASLARASTEKIHAGQPLPGSQAPGRDGARVTRTSSGCRGISSSLLDLYSRQPDFIEPPNA